MSGSALRVMGKAPRAGGVKTRLCPPLRPEQAADFYAAMLADVLEASARAVRELGIDCALLLHPESACREIAQNVPPEVRVVAQRGEGLAERMGFAFVEAAAAGADRIVVRGSDSPAMGSGLLREAFETLETHDLVLSPDQGGGYALVGLRAPAPGLFDHPMSTAGVLDSTLANAQRLGLRTVCISASFDLDEAGDVSRLLELRGRDDAEMCMRSLALAAELGPWPTRGGN